MAMGAVERRKIDEGEGTTSRARLMPAMGAVECAELEYAILQNLLSDPYTVRKRPRDCDERRAKGANVLNHFRKTTFVQKSPTEPSNGFDGSPDGSTPTLHRATQQLRARNRGMLRREGIVPVPALPAIRGGSAC